jgi:myosin heavy subunit
MIYTRAGALLISINPYEQLNADDGTGLYR